MDKSDKNDNQHLNAYLSEQKLFQDYIDELTARCTDDVETFGRVVAFCASALHRLNRYMDMLGNDVSRKIFDAVDAAEAEQKDKAIAKSNIIPFNAVRKPKGVN